jgi:predicted HAD superfamily phosphohydrolase
MFQVQLNIACEGPLVLNDNAFELCREFLAPDGEALFTQVSRYNDYLGDIAQKPDYRAGNTLKLILPFLKSAGLTNARIAEFSRQHVTLMPRAEEAYHFLHTLNFPLFAISASYSRFAEAVAEKLGFKAENLFCTELDLERYELSDAEAGELRRLLGDIVAAAAIILPPEAKTPEDLAPELRETIRLLDTIFRETIPRMNIGRMYREVNTMGGPEKARVLKDSLARTGLNLTNAMYVGDSITDVPALENVRAGGGVAVAFNADRFAMRAAEIIVVADTAWPVALLTAVFQSWGKEGVVELAQSTRPGASRYLVLPEAMIEPIVMGLQGGTFNLYHPSTSRREEVIADSDAMRRRLRGAASAGLG